jgi:hypothetical protein
LAIVKGSWTVRVPPDLIGAAAARGMSKPTPIVLFLVGIGLDFSGCTYLALNRCNITGC